MKVKREIVQLSALKEDAEYFKKLQKEYRENEKYAWSLFHDMIKAYKEKFDQVGPL